MAARRSSRLAQMLPLALRHTGPLAAGSAVSGAATALLVNLLTGQHQLPLLQAPVSHDFAEECSCDCSSAAPYFDLHQFGREPLLVLFFLIGLLLYQALECITIIRLLLRRLRRELEAPPRRPAALGVLHER